MSLRALTLWRPWPWAMTYGGKHIENRGKPPPRTLLGERLALHAGKTWDYDGCDFIKGIVSQVPRSSADHPVGIVAVVRVLGWIAPDGEIVLWSKAPSPSDIRASLDMRWYMGEYGWIVDETVPIDPVVPCAGAQGLWKVPDDVLALVRERWKRSREAQRLASEVGV